MNEYHAGTRVKCQMTFYADEAETTPADPTAVTFMMKVPRGPITTYVYLTDAQLVKVSTGVYRVMWDTNGAADGVGVYTYYFHGTGAVVESKEKEFKTKKTIFLGY